MGVTRAGAAGRWCCASLFSYPDHHQPIGNEFIYIISAVVGGCLLTGGYGSAVGAAIGALIFGMVNQGIVYAGWDPDWFTFFLGALLLGAILLNTFIRRRAEAHR